MTIGTLLLASEVQPNKIEQPLKSSSLELSKCDEALEKATEIHWLYVNGKIDIHVDYNEYEKAKQICGGLQ